MVQGEGAPSYQGVVHPLIARCTSTIRGASHQRDYIPSLQGGTLGIREEGAPYHVLLQGAPHSNKQELIG